MTGADEEKEGYESLIYHVIYPILMNYREARSAGMASCLLVVLWWAGSVHHAAQSICSTACLASACPSVCLFASWLSAASPYCLHLSGAFSAAEIHMSSWPAAQDRQLRRRCACGPTKARPLVHTNGPRNSRQASGAHDYSRTKSIATCAHNVPFPELPGRKYEISHL